MTAGVYTLIIEQNANLKLKITLKNKKTGALTNLTGCSGILMLRKLVGSPDIALTISTDNGWMAFGGATGIITTDVPFGVTAALAAGNYVYDFLLIDSLGEHFRKMQGPAIVSPAVTR